MPPPESAGEAASSSRCRCAERLDVADVTLVQGAEVVDVDAVLHHELPVGPGPVQLRTLDHLHSHFGLIGDQIEVLRRARQILGQGAWLLRIEGREHETPVTVAAVPRQAEVGFAEAWTVPVRERNSDQVTLVGECPVVVRAPERSGLPGWLRADQGPRCGQLLANTRITPSEPRAMTTGRPPTSRDT